MYRDDTCPVCGESLPPDHLYCREHSVDVDERLHDVAATVRRLGPDLAEAARLLRSIHLDTFDYVAESQPDDPTWPPAPVIEILADAEDVDVDVDTEPGKVRVRLSLPLATALDAVAIGLADDEVARFTAACAEAKGANATH